MDNLTDKEREILVCIKEFIASYGYPPTIREICKIKNYSSTSTIHSYINKLIDKGFIKRDVSLNRSIKLLVDNEFDKLSVINIPVINGNSFIEMPISFFKKNKDVYAYIMNDNTFLKDSIIKGDVLFIVKHRSFNDNDFIAYIDDNIISIRKYDSSFNGKCILGKVIYIFRSL